MQKSELKGGIILSYITIIIGNGISIIYTPIMLRLLGQSEYGLLSLASSVVAYLGLLGFGIAASYIRYNSKYREVNDHEGEARLNGMFIVIYTIIGIISFICGLILIANINSIFNDKLTVEEINSAKILMFILVINIAISFPASVFGMYNNAYEKFLFGRILALITTIISPLITLPLLLMGGGSVVIVLVQTVTSITTTIIMIYYSIKHLKMRFIFSGFRFDLAKEIFIFSGFVFINIIVDQINWNVDKFLLGMFVGTTGVAIYAIGAQFNTYYLSMSYAISGVFSRRINAIVAAGADINKLSAIFNDVGRIQFLVLGLIMTGFSLCGKQFIELWAGPDYKDSFKIAMILMIPGSIPLLQYMGAEILRAMNKHQIRSIVFLGIGIGNILISIPLCLKWQGVGCAIGTSIALILGNLFFMNIYYHKVIGLDVIKFWKGIFSLFPGTIIALILGKLLLLILPVTTIISFLIFASIFMVIYVSSLWGFMSNKEKAHIVGPIKKYLAK